MVNYLKKKILAIIAIVLNTIAFVLGVTNIYLREDNRLFLVVLVSTITVSMPFLYFKKKLSLAKRDERRRDDQKYPSRKKE